MNVVAIVQARLKSTRLPAKILLDLGGKTALEQCLRRVRMVVDHVVVATSDTVEDDVVERVSRRLGFPTFRGSEADVLSRYAGAARVYSADVILRFTSDCPLIDPRESARVLSAFLQARPDYASNIIDRRLPRGLDTEVFSRDVLEKIVEEATSSDEREHVTLRLYRNQGRFRLVSIRNVEDLAHHRWTLDTLDDYRFLHALYELGPGPHKEDVLELLGKHPELREINSRVIQKPT